MTFSKSLTNILKKALTTIEIDLGHHPFHTFIRDDTIHIQRYILEFILLFYCVSSLELDFSLKVYLHHFENEITTILKEGSAGLPRAPRNGL